MDVHCVTSGYKSWGGAVLYEIVPDDAVVMLEKYKTLVESCADARQTMYAIEYAAKGPGNETRKAEDETPFSRRDVASWVELLQWCASADSHAEVARKGEETLSYMRRGQKKEEYSIYQDWTRKEPVETRYRGRKGGRS